MSQRVLFPTYRRSARFSADRMYRYTLSRSWGWGPTAMFIGLNPSVADEVADDRTIRRCVGFAQSWGCGGLLMVNLFAFVATKPEDMKAAEDPVGPENDEAIKNACRYSLYRVACWGVHGGYRNRDRIVAKLLPNLKCFGRTKHGCPKHPLYLRSDTELREFVIER